MPAIADSLSFHVVTAGNCVVTLDADDPVSLRAGDLALVPHGRGHVLASAPGLAPTGRVDLVPQHYLTDNYSFLRYGGDGERTTMVCGVVSFDDPAARALMRILPSVIHVDAMAAAGHAINDTIRLLSAELGDLRPGGEAVTTRLTDVLVIQAIRAWLDRSDAADSGWLGALQDPRIGQALRAVHREPGHDWALATLAGEAGMSRSSFAAHFAEPLRGRLHPRLDRTLSQQATPCASSRCEPSVPGIGTHAVEEVLRLVRPRVDADGVDDGEDDQGTTDGRRLEAQRDRRGRGDPVLCGPLGRLGRA